MKANRSIAIVIRWIARIWGGISLLFLLFMVGAHIIGALSGTSEGSGFVSTQEFISFLLFPISIMIGLGLAMRWEGLGGIITILGIAGFHTIRPDLILDPMIDGLAVPGLFFIIYWLIDKNLRKT